MGDTAELGMNVGLDAAAGRLDTAEEVLELVVLWVAADWVVEMVDDEVLVTPMVVRILGVPWNCSVLWPVLQSQSPPSMQQYESTPLPSHF